MSTGAIRAGRAYVEIGAKDKLTNFLKNSEKRLQAFGRGVSMLGGGMAAMGGAGVAAIAGVTSVFSGFDAGMAAVRANTGATGEQLASLRNTAKDLGASTKFSATEAASGMNELAKAGFSANEILAGIPATLSLAAAGGIELGEAAEIAANVSGAFGLAADEIGRVSDVIATTANVSTTGVLEMGETFKYVAPLAKVAGQSIEEMAAASAILAANGTKGSMAGTDLKGILSKLATSDVQEQFKELGVEVVDATGKMRPMMDVMRDYGEATASMTDSERISNAVGVFGEISAKSAIAISTAGDAIDEMRDKMNGSAGAAATMASVMEDSLGGSITTFKSALESVAIEIGEALAPALRMIVDTSSTWLRILSGLVSKNKGLVIGISAAIVGIGVMGTALLGIGGAISLTGFAIGGLVTAIGVMTTVIGTIGLPFTIAIAAVAALGAALFAGIGAFFVFTDSGHMALGFLKDSFIGLWNFIKPIFAAITNALKGGDWALAANIAWAGLKAVFWKGAASINEVIRSLSFHMVKAFADALKRISWAVVMFTAQFAKAIHKIRSMDFSGAMAAMGPSALSKTFNSLLSPQALKEFDKYAEKRSAQANEELKALMDESAKYAAAEPSTDPAEPAKPATPVTRTPEQQAMMDELDKRRKEAEAAIAASGVDPDSPDFEPPEIPDPPEFEPPEIPDYEFEDSLGPMANIPDGQNLTDSSGQSNAGTFSSAAAALMGAGAGGGPMNRVAKATERSQELLETIDKNMAVTAKWEGMVHTA